MVTNKHLSRRDFLKTSAALAAGTWLSAHLPAVAAREATAFGRKLPVQMEAAIEFMINTGELSEDEIAQFEADNPGITVTRIDTDLALYYARVAAGNSPDIMRVQAPMVPQMLARNIPMNLQANFETSTVLQPDDLAPANNYYKATDAFHIGEGDIYGMTKDWSPDLTVWVNDLIFEEAGLDPLDDSEPMAYEDIADLARQLTVAEGDRILVTGFAFHDAWVDRYWMTWLLGLGESLFSEDFTQINLVNNEAAREAIRWHVDLAADKATFSPINPSVSWPGIDFAAGSAAMAQYGFWYSGGLLFWIEDEALIQAREEGKFRMLPAPTWKGVRLSPTITATGTIITGTTPNPEAAWRVYEWYNGQEPAVARAQSGWGVPALKSMFDLVPQEGVYREQVWKVLEQELEYSGAVLPFNPYLLGGEPGVVGSSFQANWELVLTGDMDFDTMLQNIEDEVNFAILDGIDAIG